MTAEGLSTSAPEAPATRRPALWRHRDFRLVWTGQTLSELGTGVSQLAYPLLVLAMTGSPVYAGAVSAARALPYVFFGLVAGALVDRWNRKRVMILCDTLRAVNMAAIPIAAGLGVLTVGQVIVAAFVGGSLYVFFSAAEEARLPNIGSGSPREFRPRAPTDPYVNLSVYTVLVALVLAPVGTAQVQ
ncbi:MFS family permease [Catenulispora sp. GP43]|uniref:MFS transporter n=1 Tax=Catenulispora sp. GP43 TaxID=3156263 RepID=UPI003511EB30